MSGLDKLFDNNRDWANSMVAQDAEFFSRLSQQQAPDYLWVGCADSRVPANEIIGMLPGEVFVHRNVANVVVHSDLNFLSVLQYGVDVLKVEHVIVCGHYGCGGVCAAVQNDKLGLIDNWLRHVQDVEQKHKLRLASIDNGADYMDRMCELNVVEQVVNVAQSTVVQDAWARGQALSVHGCVYRLSDGIMHDLDMSLCAADQIGGRYEAAVDKILSQQGPVSGA